MNDCVELHLPGRDRIPKSLPRAIAPIVATEPALELAERKAISLRLSGRQVRVACVTGRLWATVSGSAEDYVLLPGEARTFHGRGRVVIQALLNTAARVDCNPWKP